MILKVLQQAIIMIVFETNKNVGKMAKIHGPNIRELPGIMEILCIMIVMYTFVRFIQLYTLFYSK